MLHCLIVRKDTENKLALTPRCWNILRKGASTKKLNRKGAVDMTACAKWIGVKHGRSHAATVMSTVGSE